MADRFALEQYASQWKSTGATPEDIEKCGGALECWTWFPFNGDPAALQVTEGTQRDWKVLWEEPIGPADDTRVAQHLNAARGLLVGLLDGLAEGTPVVMAVPEDRFGAGDSLFAIVDFARRALPGSLRKRCRIRCFAKNLAKYFDDFGADLLIIPAPLLQTAVSLRREAILLDEKGSRISTEKERHADYGNLVCDQFRRSPEKFADLSDRISSFIPDVPSAPQTYLIPLLGALSRGEPGQQMPDRFEILEVNWSAAIRAGDFALFQTESLCRIALLLDDGRTAALAEIGRRREPAPSQILWDDEMRARPAAAVDVLLASGSWQEWREMTRCSSDQLHTAATHWCGSSHWRDCEPFLEDWVTVVRDLSPMLKPADLQVMRSGRLQPFPSIAYFEDRQARDIENIGRSRTETDQTVVIAEPEVRPVEEPTPGTLQDEEAPVESGWKKVRGWWRRSTGPKEHDDD